MKRTLRMKCPNCGHWNRIPVDKLFIEQPSPEPKVRVMIPMYEPLQMSKCKKCGKVIAEPKELIRIESLIYSRISESEALFSYLFRTAI